MMATKAQAEVVEVDISAPDSSSPAKSLAPGW